jgi:(p)ppGpp synthase/HD superfamily hydrolase
MSDSKAILEAIRNDQSDAPAGISDLEWDAACFAYKAHEGQTRKVTGEPYINHCGAVADILRINVMRSDLNEMLAGAWMHDVIEDTRYDLAHILLCFGTRVALLVLGMTSASKLCCPRADRVDRKRIDRMVMSSQPLAVKTIKVADIMHNAMTIAGCGKDFALMWFRESLDMLDVMNIGGSLVSACRAKIAEEIMKLNVHAPDGVA